MHKTFLLLGVGLAAVAAGVGGATYVGAQGTPQIGRTEILRTPMVDAGNMVRATDLTGVVAINQIHPIFVVFSLPADSLAQLRARLMDGGIEVTAQDSNGQDLAVGKLSVIDNQINPASGTIQFKATFDNTNEVLWPGQFVNVRVLGYRAIGKAIP